MTRRKIIAASLFFTLFGALALMPPLVLLARFDGRVLGIPVDTVYVFALWLVMIVGAHLFSRSLPNDRPPGRQRDGRP